MAKKDPNKITDKEDDFCKEYVVSWNGTRAAMDSGFSKNKASAAVIAYRLLRNVKIRARVEELMKEKAMAREEVLARLSSQARATHEHFIRINADGFIEFDFSDPEAEKHLHLIKKIKTKRQRQIIPGKKGRGKNRIGATDDQEWEHEWVEVELHDPQKALELIGKHYSLFIDRDDKGKPLVPKVKAYISVSPDDWKSQEEHKDDRNTSSND